MCAVSVQHNSRLRLKCLYLLYKVPEEDGFLPQGIMNQAFRKEDHSVGEIVLREPRYHALFLHIWTACDVDD